MKKKIAFSFALCSACAIAQTDEVTSYDDAFFDESATVSEEPAPTAPNSERISETSLRNSAKSSDITVLDGLSVEDESEMETAPVDTKTKAESVKILDTKELQGSSATIAEATNRSSGVKIRQSGGLGGESKINIRGMEGKNVKVLVDGVPVDNGSGNFSVNDIPIDKIDRIEIYKSYVPERFATDGMGGIINVVTHRLPNSSISGSYSFGSFNTHKASLDAKYVWVSDSTKNRSVEIGLSAYYNYSDNDYEFTTPYMDTTVTRDHDRYYSYNISPFVNFNNFWFDRISLGAGFGSVDKEIQSNFHRIEDAVMEGWSYGFTFGLEKKDLFVKGLSGSVLFEFSHNFENITDTTHIYYTGWSRESYRRSKALAGEIKQGGATLYERYNNSFLIPWNFDYAFNKKHILSWSGIYRYDSQEPKDKLAVTKLSVSGFPGHSHGFITGLSLENNFLDSRLQNVVGIKGFIYKLAADDDGAKLQRLGGENIDFENFGYSENIRFKVIEPFAIKGSYQHSLRFPTHEEVFGDGLYRASSPNLNPEISDNFTAGAELELNNMPLLLRLHLEFNWFYLLMDDRIYWSSLAAVPQPYYNSVGTKTHGFEIEASVDVNEYLAISYNVTNQDVRSREKDLVYGIDKDLIVPNIPLFYMNFGAEFHIGDLLFKDDFFKLYWTGCYTDEYYYNWNVSRRQKRIIPSSFFQDIGVEYSVLANKLSWSFEVRNFTDALVYDKYGESKAGRSFASKIKFNL